MTFRLFVSMLMLALVSACGTTQADDFDFAAMAKQGVVIDTRTVEEFNAGHIEGAKLIPYDVIQFKIGQLNLDKDTPILLYCRSGRRAGIAEKTLEQMGYTQVHNLGGMSEAIQLLEATQ